MDVQVKVFWDGGVVSFFIHNSYLLQLFLQMKELFFLILVGLIPITDGCHPDGWGDFVGGYPSTCAIDLSAGCGASIISPISGDMVAYADDGLRIGNTAAIIKGSRYTAFLLHGDYVASGPIQQGGLIGHEASHGNSFGCHTHISIFDHIEKKWVNPIGRRNCFQ